MKDWWYIQDSLQIEMPEHTHVLGPDNKVYELKSSKTLLDSLQVGKQLEVKVPATHSGRLTNARVYPGHRMKDSTKTWLADFPKPWMDRHPSSGPMKDLERAVGNMPKTLGRVTDATYVHLVTGDGWTNDYRNPTSGAGSGFIELTSRIADADAIAKLLSGQTKTVSVGAHTDAMICSICDQDWQIHGTCDHEPLSIIEDGKTSSKRLAYLITGNLHYDHVAEEAFPGDKYAAVSAMNVLDSRQFIPKLTAKWTDGMRVIPSRLALIDSQGSALVGLTENQTKNLVDSGTASGKTQITRPEIKLDSHYSKTKAAIVADLHESGLLTDSGRKEFAPIIDAWYTLPANERHKVRHSLATRVGTRKALPVTDDLQTGISLSLIKDKFYGGPESAKWVSEQALKTRTVNDGADMAGNATTTKPGTDPASTGGAGLTDTERATLNDALESSKKRIAQLETELAAAKTANTTVSDELKKVRETNLKLQADKVLDLRVSIGDEDAPASPEARKTVIDALVARGQDSLAHTIVDLEARKAKTPKQKTGQAAKEGAAADLVDNASTSSTKPEDTTPVFFGSKK